MENIYLGQGGFDMKNSQIYFAQPNFIINPHKKFSI